jgi:hypothetical protein
MRVFSASVPGFLPSSSWVCVTLRKCFRFFRKKKYLSRNQVFVKKLTTLFAVAQRASGEDELYKISFC